MLYICRYLWRHCGKYCGSILQFVICVSNKWKMMILNSLGIQRICRAFVILLFLTQNRKILKRIRFKIEFTFSLEKFT